MNYIEGRFEKLFEKGLRTRNRNTTMRRAVELFIERGGKIIVETGVARNTRGFQDGNSTKLWADLVLLTTDGKGHVHTVDICPEACEGARELTAGYKDCVTIYEDDSVNFLKNFREDVDLLYLDSMNIAVDGYQEHHLEEIKMIEPCLHNDTIILIDDSPNFHFENLEHERVGGKGALVIPYLEERGWTVVMRDYQTILLKNFNKF